MPTARAPETTFLLPAEGGEKVPEGRMRAAPEARKGGANGAVVR
jgi:hypothetical protein